MERTTHTQEEQARREMENAGWRRVLDSGLGLAGLAGLAWRVAEYWEAEGEAELQAQAVERAELVEDGLATLEDFLGLLDWADFFAEGEEAEEEAEETEEEEAEEMQEEGHEEYSAPRTEEEAMELVRKLAQEHPAYLDRDLDALQEIGEVDTETIFGGYLWDVVEDTCQEMDEETNELLADAIVEFFLGMWEECEEECEECEECPAPRTEADARLLAVLKDHTIRNAREILHQIWKDGDEDGIYEALAEAIERCENDTGTDADWDMLVEQTEM